MRTIDFYEKVNINKLKFLFKYYEKISREIDLKLVDSNLSEKQYLKYKNIRNDCDIDLQLIHMELNKRLWYNNLNN